MDISSSPTPSSAPSGSAAPPTTNPSPPARVIARPVKRAGGGYMWRDEEVKLFDKLVKSYGSRTVNWEAVAEELARRCPMDPAPARTAHHCASRLSWMKSNDKTRKASAPPPWSKESWAQLEAAVMAAQATSRSEKLTIEHWTTIGSALSPRRSGPAAKRRWSSGSPETNSVSNPSGSSSRQASSSAPPSSSPAHSDASQNPHLVSIAEQPLSAADDLELLRLNAVHPGGVYKTISRLMNPKRHKKDVKDRLQELLSLDEKEFSISEIDSLSPVTPAKRPASPPSSNLSTEERPPPRRLRLILPAKPSPLTVTEQLQDEMEQKLSEKIYVSGGREMMADASRQHGEALESRLKSLEDEVRRLKRRNRERGQKQQQQHQARTAGRGDRAETELLIAEGGRDLAGTLEEALEGLRELSTPCSFDLSR